MSAFLRDKYQLSKKITLRKAINALRLLVSFYYSRAVKKADLTAMPMGLSIEPTTSCNLRCSECPSGLRAFTRPTGMLKQETFRKIVDELESKLIWLTFYFQGEPYLNREFLDMVKYASGKGLYTMTSTNAHYFTEDMARKTIESGLSRIIISMDGMEQDTYEKYRAGGSLEKVKEGLARLIKWKKELRSSTPHIVLQFIVFEHNQHEINAIKKWGKKSGVDEVKIKSAQIYDPANSELIPSDKKYSRYEKEGDSYRIKNSLMDHCWRMWSSAVVTWDGKVIPCCFDKDAHYQLGNIQNGSFESVWKSSAYNEFRDKVLVNRKSIDICTNCTEGTEVWL